MNSTQVIPRSARSATSNGLFSRLVNNEALVAYLFILPSLIGFVAFYAVPAVRNVIMSFNEWNMLSEPKAVGLENYQALFADERFRRSLMITLSYVLWNIPIQTALALFMAVMMNRIHNSALLRGVLVLPWLLPNVVVGLLWLWMLDPTLGIVNAALQGLGLPKQPFLGDPNQVIPTIAGINIWRHAGYTAILLFAGLKAIPRTLYEAAAIDGANEWTQFLRITLPLLRPVLVFVLVTSVIGSFQVFDTVAITTRNGGPAGSASVIIWYIYDLVFNKGFKMGLAAAASVILFIILVTVTVIQTRVLRGNRSDLADYA
jgi:multiple sugar transport system permease protein